MAENIISLKDVTGQEGRERPPLALISAGGEIVDSPTKVEILDEIHLLVISPIRAIYALFSESGNSLDYPKGRGAISDTLFVALEQWDRLSKYL